MYDLLLDNRLVAQRFIKMDYGKNKKLKFEPWKEAESFLHLIDLRLTYDALAGNEWVASQTSIDQVICNCEF